MTAAIETNNLVKRYGDVTAVDHLSLHVQRGEIYAFLGLNGAGKTTTIRLLLGMVRPTAGEARVLGRVVGAGSGGPWHAVGYLVETATAYPELTVRENLEVMRRLRPGTPATAVDDVMAQLGLTVYADRRAGTLSQGNAQRLGLTKALLHKPELLILDEPANGLDPAGIVEIRHLLLKLAAEQGVTIFMSSHNLAEVSRLAQRIGIIHEGQLQQELDAAALARNRRRRLVVGVSDSQGALAALRAAGFAPVQTGNGTLELRDEGAIAHPDMIAVRLVEAGYAPTKLVAEREDLEDTFMRLVGKNGENGR